MGFRKAWSLFVFISVVAAEASANAHAGTQIWLSPLQPIQHPSNAPNSGRVGSADFFGLFEPSAPWSSVAGRVAVFKIYPDVLNEGSDDQLRHMFRDLAARHIALAVEFSAPLRATASCPAVIQPAPRVPDYLLKIKRLGGDVRYIALVGPLVDGHVNRRASGCRASIPAVAADAAATAAAILRVFPRAKVGDIEDVGHGVDSPTPEEIHQWIAAYKSAAGRPLAFLHLDVNWGGSWWEDVRSVALVARAAHVDFGCMYTPDGRVLSSAEAARQMSANAQAVESLLGGKPDQVVFQTWWDYPDHVLPETDPASITGALFDYLRPKTQLERLNTGEVKLTDAQGAAIARASLTLEEHLEIGPRSLARQGMEGKVPIGAVKALFALRAHEACRGPCREAAVALGPFEYTEGQSVGPGFRESLVGWRSPGVAQDLGTDGWVRRIRASEHPVLNGEPFPVTSGSQFHARFGWRIDAQGDGQGYAALIFLDATGREIQRLPHEFAETFIVVGTARTDKKGVAIVSATASPDAPELRVVYAGDKGHAPSQIAHVATQ